MMAKLVAGLLALSELALTNAVDKEQSIEELMASMKGMPGMEGIKMFTADDLKNMDDPAKMAGMFGNGPKKPKKQTRSQYRRRLVDFYEKYGLADKLDGVDAALDKWKGREEKMFTALNKKYQDVIDAKWEADVKEVKAEEEEIKKAKQEEEAEAAAADAAFGSKQEL